MTTPDQYDGREQAFVKHSLLKEYLPQLSYRVGREWEKLVYVDAFAGPWQVASAEYADSSFGVAVSSLKRALAGLREKWSSDVSMQSILLATTATKRKELDAYAQRHRADRFAIEPMQGEFAELITEISEKIAADRKRAFRFVFLDPKGWGEIPMQQMSDFLNARSCEVLVTLMTLHIKRFLDQPDRADSYRRLFGRDGVLEHLQKTPREQQAEQALLEYCASLKKLCGFRYVSCAAVLRPDREEVLYYLVFGTNHPKGVEVFKDAEMAAAKLQDWVRIDAQARKGGQPELLLDGDGQKTQVVQELRARFCQRARGRVLDLLIKKANVAEILYAEVFCEAMAFPLVTPDDLHNWLSALKPAINLVLEGLKRKIPSPDKTDHIVVIDVPALQAELWKN